MLNALFFSSFPSSRAFTPFGAMEHDATRTVSVHPEQGPTSAQAIPPTPLAGAPMPLPWRSRRANGVSNFPLIVTVQHSNNGPCGWADIVSTPHGGAGVLMLGFLAVRGVPAVAVSAAAAAAALASTVGGGMAPALAARTGGEARRSSPLRSCCVLAATDRAWKRSLSEDSSPCLH